MRCLLAQRWVAGTSSCSRYCFHAHSVRSSTSSYLGQSLRPLPLFQLRGWRARGGDVHKRSRTAQRVQASFFGVGAPEALMVGVVALIVFGPKGLAEAAKSLGKTLRAFQPTIRELASVSSDLKNTLEEQIGLDEIRAEFRNSTVPVRRPTAVSDQAQALLQDGPDVKAALEPQAQSFPSDLPSQTALDPDIARKKEESARAAWGTSNGATASAPPVEAAAGGQESSSSARGGDGGASDSSAQGGRDLSSRSLEELEAELARRRANVK